MCWRLAPDPCSGGGGGGGGISVNDVVVSETQTIAAASDTITIPATGPDGDVPRTVIKLLRNVTGSSITLTSVPNINDGAFVGQELLLYTEQGSNGVVIQDEAILAGSNFRLAASANKTIGARDSIRLFWQAEGVWLQSVALLQA